MSFEIFEEMWKIFDENYNSKEGFKRMSFDMDYHFAYAIMIILWCICNWPKIQFIKLIRLLPWDFRFSKDDSRFSKSKTLYIQPKNYYETCVKPRLRIYWSVPGISTLAFHFDLGGEENEIGFTFWIKAIFLKVALENVYKNDSVHSKTTGFTLDWEDAYISFYWMSGFDDSPIFFHFKEFFLGKLIYKSENVTTDEVLLSFDNDPDKYPCTIHINEDSWTYSRIPLRRTLKRCDMQSKLGIPRGDRKYKGDRTYGWGFPCNSVGEAINYIKESVEYDRKTYGFVPLDPVKLSEEILTKTFTIEA